MGAAHRGRNDSGMGQCRSRLMNLAPVDLSVDPPCRLVVDGDVDPSICHPGRFTRAFHQGEKGIMGNAGGSRQGVGNGRSLFTREPHEWIERRVGILDDMACRVPRVDNDGVQESVDLLEDRGQIRNRVVGQFLKSD